MNKVNAWEVVGLTRLVSKKNGVTYLKAGLVRESSFQNYQGLEVKEAFGEASLFPDDLKLQDKITLIFDEYRHFCGARRV